MATYAWPTGPEFEPRELSFGASLPHSAHVAPFTGNTSSIGHLSDRLRCTITLPPCDGRAGQAREGFFLAVASGGHFLQLGHPHRLLPQGTLRGLPVSPGAVAGARVLPITAAAGATLVVGDVLGVAGQLVMVGPIGATADGAGAMSVQLAVPLVTAVPAASAVTWQAPVGRWELVLDQALSVRYGRGAWQRELELTLLQRP